MSADRGARGSIYRDTADQQLKALTARNTESAEIGILFFVTDVSIHGCSDVVSSGISLITPS